MGYGLLTGVDIDVVEQGLQMAMKRFSGPIRVVEIGVRDGSTCLGMKSFIESKKRRIDYSGFDNGRDMAVGEPYYGERDDPLRAKIYLGDSAETYRFCPSDVHFLFIDGCHCVNHVIVDCLHFGEKVAIGGLMAFHDMAPSSQGKNREGQYQGHGPQDQEHFGIAVREAHRLLGILDDPINSKMWKKVRVDWDKNSWWGGVALFERIA